MLVAYINTTTEKYREVGSGRWKVWGEFYVLPITLHRYSF
jgi:hypothetical protein